ncbi:helix-turn-helix domain-containing protein [Niallia taxi]|uniref:recombinase family protein n=1 Tax=Niallia taxi TaxID=2499688 RepID=UPI003981E471
MKKIGYIKNFMDELTPKDEILKKMKIEGVQRIIMDLDETASPLELLLNNIDSMESKDILVVENLDEIGESLKDIIQIIEKLNDKDIGILILDEAVEDLASAAKKDWTIQTMLRKQLLLTLKWVYEKELNDIRKRETVGMQYIKSLKEKRTSGRPKKYHRYAEDPEDRRIYLNVVKMLDNNVSITRISEAVNISRNTVYVIRDELNEERSRAGTK